MKRILLFFILFISHNSFAQNDYVMLSRIRPLIEVEVNEYRAAMLIDTGSELNLINKSMIKIIGAEKHITQKLAFGAGGQINIWEISKCDLKIKGLNVTNIMATDLDITCDNIEHTTGIKVIGILGAPGIKELGMIIDLKRGVVTIKK